ncbi:MAG: outer membrane protein assembly factor BamB [Verrucomicrobiales bacterium]|jgi:outer membrane protein assembly factor BamB
MKLPILLLACSIQISVAADWAHWRGPARNDLSTETSGWDDGVRIPDRELWKASFGTGASAPLIVNGVLYTLGWRDNADTLYAVDAADGTALWTQSYPAPKYGRHAKGDQNFFQGTTATPEFDPETGYLYSLSCDGELRCWDTRRQRSKVWGMNLYDTYKVPMRPQVTERKGSHRDYGYTSAPLVSGQQLLVEVGSPDQGNVIAFDKKSGKEIWKSENRDHAGHSGGLAPIEIEGKPCIAVITALNLLVMRIDSGSEGRTVGEFEWTTDFINNIPTPAVSGNRVLVSSRYNKNAMALVEFSLGGAPREVWKIGDASGVCSLVIFEGHVYWSGKGLHCIELATGKKKWEGSKFGDAGSCIVTADGRLLVWSDSGDLTLAETARRSPDRYTELQKNRNVFRGMAWPHVVLADQRIYCRDIGGDMKCFSLRKDEQGKTPAAPQNPSMPTKPADLDLTDWPGDGDPGLFFAWKRGMATAAPLGAIAAQSRVRITARDGAKFDDAGRMDVTSGSFHVQGASAALTAAAGKTNQLTIETVLTAADLRQTGPARVISFSTDGYNRNFSLVQERDQLRLRLRTPQAGDNGMKPESKLCTIEAGKPLHVLVTYRPGELSAYVNGERVHQSDAVQGDFSNWDAAQQLVFGSEFEDDRNWAGVFDAIAILNRFVSPEEAAERFRAAVKK